MSRPEAHPNRLPFSGILMLVDCVSDFAPFGSEGHRVLIPSRVAEAALPSMIGMAVNYQRGWAGHDPRSKIGIITRSAIMRGRVHVEGYIYAWDFPEVEQAAQELDLGMSFDIHDVDIKDTRREIWTLDRLTFTGAAILLRKDAAFTATWFLTSRPELPVESSLPRFH